MHPRSHLLEVTDLSQKSHKHRRPRIRNRKTCRPRPRTDGSVWAGFCLVFWPFSRKKPVEKPRALATGNAAVNQDLSGLRDPEEEVSEGWIPDRRGSPLQRSRTEHCFCILKHGSRQEEHRFFFFRAKTICRSSLQIS